MTIHEEFKKFLRDQNVYEDFEEEIKPKFATVDDYLRSLPRAVTFPGCFIDDAFSWWHSKTQKPDKAYSFWASIHWRWKTLLNSKPKTALN
jgi:hypothetical protein